MSNELLNRYPNLPGFKVGFNDGNLYSDQSNLQANTQSVLILGSAIDGPVGEPVSVLQLGGVRAAEKLFGGVLKKEVIETKKIDPKTGEKIKEVVKIPHEGTLIRTMYEVLEAGNQDVRLLRIDGKSAKTELPVKDSAQQYEQFLGNASGNIAFSHSLSLETGERLNANSIEYVREKNASGNVVREVAGSGLSSVVTVDTNKDYEAFHFAANQFRPKNTLEVKYKYSKRTYHSVLRSDEDGVLTQDPTKPNYFASVRPLWSDDVAAGHTISVYVDGSAIPQVNSKGQFLWRPGKEDPNVTNELTDYFTTTEFEQGGIRFTSAYLEEVAKGIYPELKSSSVVNADYYYYEESQLNNTVTINIPGQNTTYTLNYVPNLEEFRVYYLLNDNEYELTLKDVNNPNGDYSIIFPSSANEKAKIVINAGAAPVGVKVYASYKTDEGLLENPVLIVEGKYPGSIYGRILDPSDENSLYGVTVEVYEDNTVSDQTGYEKGIVFRKPEEKMLTSDDQYLEYKTRELEGIRTLREFVNYVNNDPKNNIVHLSIANEAGSIPVQGLMPTGRPVYLGEFKNPATGEFELLKDETKSKKDPDYYPWLGNDGFFKRDDLLSMDKLYKKLGGVYEYNESTNEYTLKEEGVYNRLENYAVDIIFLAEANENTPIGKVIKNEVNDQEMVIIDDRRNFGTQLAQHCAIVTAKTWETIGVIGYEPVQNATLYDIQQYINEATAAGKNVHYMYREDTHELILNEDHEPIDIGGYLSVVYGPEVGFYHPKIGEYVTNGASAYAGYTSALPAAEATTNKQIPNIRGLRYRLSEAQHNQLIGGRYVTFDQEYLRNGTTRIIVKDGVTSALPTSDYQRLSTVRITHATVQVVREVARKYIGMPGGLAQRNALSTDIQGALNKLKDSGVLQDFEFNIYSSAKDRVLGNIFIQLNLVPQFETRTINTFVSLKAQL